MTFKGGNGEQGMTRLVWMAVIVGAACVAAGHSEIVDRSAITTRSSVGLRADANSLNRVLAGKGPSCKKDFDLCSNSFGPNFPCCTPGWTCQSDDTGPYGDICQKSN